MDNSKGQRVPRIALIIGIVVVLNLFFNYSILALYPEPQYTDFCTDQQVQTNPSTQDACIAVGGQWSTNPDYAPAKPATLTTPTGYCNPTYTCQKNYDAAEKSYTRNVFIALVALGVLSIGVSFLFTTAPVVATSLSLGGALSLIIAAVRYWSQAQTILQVGILAVALIALLWLGAKRFRE